MSRIKRENLKQAPTYQSRAQHGARPCGPWDRTWAKIKSWSPNRLSQPLASIFVHFYLGRKDKVCPRQKWWVSVFFDSMPSQSHCLTFPSALPGAAADQPVNQSLDGYCWAPVPVGAWNTPSVAKNIFYSFLVVMRSVPQVLVSFSRESWIHGWASSVLIGPSGSTSTTCERVSVSAYSRWYRASPALVTNLQLTLLLVTGVTHCTFSF